MTAINFKPIFLETIHQFGKITKSVSIKTIVKENEPSVSVVRGKELSDSIVYEVIASNDHFDLSIVDGVERVNFRDYGEFYNLFSMVNGGGTEIPISLDFDGNDVSMVAGSASFNYRTSVFEDVKIFTFAGLRFNDPHVKFEITKDEIKSLNGIISGIKADYIQFSFNKNKLTMKFYGEKHSNSFKKDKEITPTENYDDKFKILIFAEDFIKIPNSDYSVEVTDDGMMKFSKNENDILINVYLADQTEE